jgi:hypothetical protein
MNFPCTMCGSRLGPRPDTSCPLCYDPDPITRPDIDDDDTSSFDDGESPSVMPDCNSHLPALPTLPLG